MIKGLKLSLRNFLMVMFSQKKRSSHQDRLPTVMTLVTEDELSSLQTHRETGG